MSRLFSLGGGDYAVFDLERVVCVHELKSYEVSDEVPDPGVKAPWYSFKSPTKVVKTTRWTFTLDYANVKSTVSYNIINEDRAKTKAWRDALVKAWREHLDSQLS